MARDLTDLTPTEFENLTFDLLLLMGVDNLVWRTPGSDGGRDIEGFVRSADFSGGIATQKWYVECKRYSTSIDWPTLWKKLAYADTAAADFLLLVTNSNPSPQCESEITKWNTRRGGVQLRVWRGYDIRPLLLSYPILAAKYGLHEPGLEPGPEFVSLTQILMKMCQANYVGYSFETKVETGIEAAAALAELISLRIGHLRSYGRFVPAHRCSESPPYAWLSWSGDASLWEEVGLRAVLTQFRYVTGATTVQFDAGSMVAVGARCPLNESALAILRQVAVAANIDIQGVDAVQVLAQLSPQAT